VEESQLLFIFREAKFWATLAEVIDESVKRLDSRIEKRLERAHPTENGQSVDQVPTGLITGRPVRRSR